MCIKPCRDVENAAGRPGRVRGGEGVVNSRGRVIEVFLYTKTAEMSGKFINFAHY